MPDLLQMYCPDIANPLSLGDLYLLGMEGTHSGVNFTAHWLLHQLIVCLKQEMSYKICIHKYLAQYCTEKGGHFG